MSFRECFVSGGALFSKAPPAQAKTRIKILEWALDAREGALYPAGLSFPLCGLMQHINRARGRARKAAGSNPSSLPNIELNLRGDEVDLS
jgi:hypothetical protein